MSEIENRFGQFILSGPDFDKKGLPIEAAEELIAYKELILDVAKKLFLQENPHRERSPRHLASEFDLRLEAVVHGSADLQITLERPPSLLDSFQTPEDIFTRSRDIVANTIDHVSKTGNLDSAFPVASLPKFRALGKTLRSGNSLFVGDLSNHVTANFDRNTREKFLSLLSADARPIAQDLIGTLVELDPERMVFHIRTPEGERTGCYYGESLSSVDKSLLADEDGDGPLVKVFGNALVGKDGSIERFTSVDSIKRVEDLTATALDSVRERVLSRLENMKTLPGGWLGHIESTEPHLGLVELSIELVQSLNVVPSTFTPVPLPDGGIRFEWTQGAVDYVAELESDGGIYLCKLDEDSSNDVDMELSNHEIDALSQFIQEGKLASAKR